MARITNGNGGYFNASEDIVIDKNFTGTLSIYSLTPSTYNLTIEAPIGGINVRNNGLYIDIVLENNAGTITLIYQGTFNTAGDFTPGPYNLAEVNIDLMPYYGVNQFIELVDFSEPSSLSDFNTIIGTAGADSFQDLVYRKTGIDVWNSEDPLLELGLSGDDDLEGSPFGDVLFGGDGGDFIGGEEGADLIYGGANTDVIHIGGSGSDLLVAGNGGNDLYLWKDTAGQASYLTSTPVVHYWDDNGVTQSWTENVYDQINTALTPIWDGAGLGSDDRMLLEGGFGTTPVMFLNVDVTSPFYNLANPLHFEEALRVEIIDGDLEFAITPAQYALDSWKVIYKPDLQWESFHLDGWMSPWGEYEFGLTELEMMKLDITDPTSYPGWDTLSAEAQSWLEVRLDTDYWSTASDYLDFLNNLTWQFHEFYEWDDWDAAQSSGELFKLINTDPQPTTGFDESDYTTYPVFPFARALNFSVSSLDSFGEFDLSLAQKGFEILGFSEGADTQGIERFMVGTEKFATDVLTGAVGEDPLGAYLESLTGTQDYKIQETLRYAEEDRGWLESVYTVKNGIADGKNETAVIDAYQRHFLVADQAMAGTYVLNAPQDSAFTSGFGGNYLSATYSNAALAMGWAGDDVLFSGYGSATTSLMHGLDGDDWFEIQGGSVTARGGYGDDVFVIRDNGQSLNADIGGFEGTDILFIDKLWEDVEYTLNASKALSGFTYDNVSITISGIETIQFRDYLITDIINGLPGPAGEVIELGDGPDTVFGDDEVQLFYTGGGADKIYAEGGDDFITVQGASSGAVIDAGSGIDTLEVDASFTGNIQVRDAEIINVTGTFTEIELGTGIDKIIKTSTGSIHLDDYEPSVIKFFDASGNETKTIDFNAILFGTSGDDSRVLSETQVDGFGYAGNDAITGNSQANTLSGGDGHDDLYGMDGNDTLDGGTGNDTLIGGLGNDTLLGGDGDDVLEGDEGSDRLEGGSGSDTYSLTSSDSSSFVGGGWGMDVVLDSSGANDIIDVSEFNWGIASSDWWSMTATTGGLVPSVRSHDDGALSFGLVRSKDGSALDWDMYATDWQSKLGSEYGINGFKIEGFNKSADSIEIIRFATNGSADYRLDTDGDASDSSVNNLLVTSQLNQDGFSNTYALGGSGNDILFARGKNDVSNDVLSGGAGNDILFAGSRDDLLEGGEGDDIFRVMISGDSHTRIIGDTSSYTSNIENSAMGNWTQTSLRDISTTNQSKNDTVEFGWSFADSVITQLGSGYRIARMDGGVEKQVIEVADVETLKFFNYETNAFDRTISLLEGESKNLASYHYVDDHVEFRFGDGTASGTDILEVWSDKGAPGTFSKIASYNRFDVDDIQFSDQTINVENILAKDWLSGSASGGGADATGTEGVDIIFGDERNNFIDGKGGNDYIFGLAGDDVLVGGAGDDVISGGDGRDQIAGDENVFDDTVTVALTGDDLIIGGADLDEIDSGSGDNVVIAGVADASNSAMNSAVETYADQTIEELFQDDEWI